MQVTKKPFPRRTGRNKRTQKRFLSLLPKINKPIELQRNFVERTGINLSQSYKRCHKGTKFQDFQGNVQLRERKLSRR